MALLAFEDVKSSPVGDLMDLMQRQKTASELNAAILDSQSQVGLPVSEGTGFCTAACAQAIGRRQLWQGQRPVWCQGNHA